jgi:predicted O-methyltransferase YrrM
MARTFQHWSVKYLFFRLVEKNYRHLNPEKPWLAPAANEFLEGYLKPTDQMLEFGSGRSTIWFSKRVKHITSIEHNPAWYKKIIDTINELSINNITYFLHPRQYETIPASETNYVNATCEFTKSSLDVVLVDGTYRAQCVLKSLPLLKPGALLIIDNVNRYLPSNSKSPNSRSITQGPIDDEWRQVSDRINSWRFFWTSNGVSDTSFFFKPQEDTDEK